MLVVEVFLKFKFEKVCRARATLLVRICAYLCDDLPPAPPPPSDDFPPAPEDAPAPMPPMAGARSDHRSWPATRSFANFAASPTYSLVTPSFHRAGASPEPRAAAMRSMSPPLSL